MVRDRYPRSHRPTHWGAFLAAAAFCGGCSLLFHVDANQCSTDSDCTAKGPAFANHTCQSGTCVSSVLIAEAGSDAGSQAEAQAEAQTRDQFQVEAQGEAQADAEAGVAEAGCATNADCPAGSPSHPEVACDVASGACIQLTTNDCPFVIGDYSGNIASPLYLGAFATLPSSAPQKDPSYLNYELAISEFTSQGGIPAWDPIKQRSGSRMPVVVVCNRETTDKGHAAMVHLTSDLHVPGVVTAFDAVTLKTMFQNDAYPNVFVINPFGANSSLTSLTTGGMLWHMLGQPSDYASAYSAFFPRIEAYVRGIQNLGSGPMRVATITANAIDTQDLRDAVKPVIRWNGQSLDQNNSAMQYLDVAIDSTLNGADPTKIDYSTPLNKLLAFKPNVIVSFAAAEFATLLQQYELSLASHPANPVPFYLIGPYNMLSQPLLQWIGINSPQSEAKRKRVAGIGAASASDTHVLAAYESRLLASIGTPADEGQEEYYDAMYFLVYSAIGAGPQPILKGMNLGQGMLSLLSGTSYDMGPSTMGAVFGALGAGGTVSLFGALGPANFTIRTGARVGEGSVYCVQRDANLNVSYVYDVLRLTTNTTADAGAPTLGGTFPCFSGACPDGGTCSL
jgi:hypothetical protein